jgi:hypothetical protein
MRDSKKKIIDIKRNTKSQGLRTDKRRKTKGELTGKRVCFLVKDAQNLLRRVRHKRVLANDLVPEPVIHARVDVSIVRLKEISSKTQKRFLNEGLVVGEPKQVLHNCNRLVGVPFYE